MRNASKRLPESSIMAGMSQWHFKLQYRVLPTQSLESGWGSSSAQLLPRCPLWLWRTGGSGRKDKKAVKGENWERRVPEEGPMSTKALEREQAGQCRGWAGGVDPGSRALSPRDAGHREGQHRGMGGFAAGEARSDSCSHRIPLAAMWAMDSEDGTGGW